MKYIVRIGGKDTPVSVDLRDDGRFDVTLDGESMQVDMRRAGGDSLFSLLIGARSCEVSATTNDGMWRLALRGATVDAAVESEQERNARLIQVGTGPSRPAIIKANMPGFVSKILVKPGDAVAKGTALLIIEAMKMENEIRADSAGSVAEVLVSERQTVNNGDSLVRIAH